MATDTVRLRRLIAASAIVVVGLLAAACGGGAGSTTTTRSAAAGTSGATEPAAGTSGATERAAGTQAFAWLKPRPVPAGWSIVRIPTGAALPYPPGWRLVSGDPGTATAVLSNSRDRFAGYLNVTPRQGEETLSNWSKFRVGHNAEEGDRDIVTLAAGSGLAFHAGHGSCVRDAYTSGTGKRYVELACLVAGPRASTVIVGAAPPSTWGEVSPSIKLAIDSFTS